jgi:trk system potassium uptake protein TrkH
VNIRTVTHVISYLVGVTALAMLAGAGISFYYGESFAAKGLLAASSISLLSAAVSWFFTRGNIDLSRKDGFGIATFGWLIVSILGALPYLFSGVIANPVPAVFETMSGFTTTPAEYCSGER